MSSPWIGSCMFFIHSTYEKQTFTENTLCTSSCMHSWRCGIKYLQNTNAKDTSTRLTKTAAISKAHKYRTYDNLYNKYMYQ